MADDFQAQVNELRLSAELIERLPLISTGDDIPTSQEVRELASHLIAARDGFQRLRDGEVFAEHIASDAGEFLKPKE